LGVVFSATEFVAAPESALLPLPLEEEQPAITNAMAAHRANPIMFFKLVFLHVSRPMAAPSRK
jgi:hypothetical protein